MTTVTRKFALTKVAAGDYLLPSNDAQTVWRFQTYTDGPSGGLDWPRDLTLWRVLRWTGLAGLGRYVDTSPECEQWLEVVCCLATRRDAIAWTLTHEPEGLTR